MSPEILKIIENKIEDAKKYLNFQSEFFFTYKRHADYYEEIIYFYGPEGAD